MPIQSTGKLARARVVPPRQESLLGSAADLLVEALQPGNSTERYNRLWRLGRTYVEDRVVFGRLGFERSGAADLWNEEKRDFIETEVPGGVAAPFALSLDNFLLVFQTRSQDIRVTSFIGAMQGILRDATGDPTWRIESARHPTSFQEWRASVSRVSRLHFNVVPPNPNYQGRPDVRRLIEELRLSAASLDLRSDEDIDTDADLVGQLLDHVERGYGTATAVGERATPEGTRETVFNSEIQGEAEVTERPADPATGEVQPDVLREELTRSALEEESVDRG
jgi:hypothetical protein